ncbi:uncharacterized protein Bfra_006312 [Botrytis fragariae]|uniref:Mid2 domain-containing protein n=1 Tax=Botrytis fragariae TaxID=1964551 RepID=A0A8H6ENW3_9HELO|nr:uncharacterized protein Bfra_006312 [Botrytis fragariae]KAF5879107.1 hypothetical protein Bfra_006312 [Botrytis fragariae]
MAPITRLTRIVPQAIILPRVSRDITQTITRRDRSSTATILLGSNTISKISKDQAVTIRSATSHVVVLSPRSTTMPIDVTETTDLSSGAIVGIVLGSILGFMVLLVLGYKCWFNRRSAVWTARYDGDGDEMVYRERRDSGEGQGRIWKSAARGGGREEWEMRCEYDDGDGSEVRRPDKAVVREERRGRGRRYRRTGRERDRQWNDNNGYHGGNRSREWEREGNRRRRSSRNAWVVVERRGILGWGKPVRSSRGRSLRRGMEMRGERGEFGRPVRSWRGWEGMGKGIVIEMGGWNCVVFVEGEGEIRG